MAIPPPQATPEASRAGFARLRELALALRGRARRRSAARAFDGDVGRLRDRHRGRRHAACASAARSSARARAKERPRHDARGSAHRLHRRRRDGGGARRRTRSRPASRPAGSSRATSQRPAASGSPRRSASAPATTNARVAAESDVVVIAVKPGRVEAALAGLADARRAARRRCGSRSPPASRSRGSRARCRRGARIVRAMPNTPALVRAGATALCAQRRPRGRRTWRSPASSSRGSGCVWVGAAASSSSTPSRGSRAAGPPTSSSLLEALGAAGERMGLPARGRGPARLPNRVRRRQARARERAHAGRAAAAGQLARRHHPRRPRAARGPGLRRGHRCGRGGRHAEIPELGSGVRCAPKPAEDRLKNPGGSVDRLPEHESPGRTACASASRHPQPPLSAALRRLRSRGGRQLPAHGRGGLRGGAARSAGQARSGVKLETRIEELASTEEILQQTLTTAQRLSDELKRTAVKEAEVRVGGAEVKAEKILDAAHRRAARLAEDIREMKLLRTRLAAAVRAAIQMHLDLLEGLAKGGEDDPQLEGRIAHLGRSPRPRKPSEPDDG